MSPTGQLMSLLRVSVEGQSLEGDAVQLERAGLALPALTPSAFDALNDDELVSRRQVELAAADALALMQGGHQVAQRLTTVGRVESAAERDNVVL